MAKTLDTIRADIQIRLGYPSSGAVAQRNRDIIHSFINQAHEEVYWQYIDEDLKLETHIPIGLGQVYIDIPPDVEIKRGLKLHLKKEGEENYRPLTHGIPELYREETGGTPYAVSTSGYQGDVTFYELEGGQIRIFPAPEVATDRLRLNYVKKYSDLTVGTDELMVDYKAVFLFALANAKAHYNQADAAAVGRQYETRIGKLRGSEHDGVRYIRDGDRMPEPRPRQI